MSKSGRVVAKGAGVVLVGLVSGRALQFVTQVLIARGLGTSGFGLYSVGWNLLQLLGVFLPLGLDAAAVRLGASAKARMGQPVSTVFWGTLTVASGFGLLVGGLLFFSAPGIARALFGKPELGGVLQVLSIAFPLVAALRVAAALTRVSRRMEFSVLSQDVVPALTNLVVFCTLSALGFGLIGALGAAVAAAGVGLGLALSFVWNLFDVRALDLRALRHTVPRMLRFSIPVSLSVLFGTSLVYIDRLMVGALRPAGEVGIYQAVSQLAILVAPIALAFATSIGPVAAEAETPAAMEAFAVALRSSIRWVLYFGLPLELCVIVAAPEILVLTFGPEFRQGATILMILGLAQLCTLPRSVLGVVLIMRGRQRPWLMLTGVCALLALLLNYLLIPRYSLAGAAVASLVVSVVALGAAERLLRKVAGYSAIDSAVLKPVACGLVAAAAAAGTGALLGTHGPATLVAAKCSVLIAIFAAGTLALGLEEADLDLLRSLRRRLGA